jgi:hypothetical protein
MERQRTAIGIFAITLIVAISILGVRGMHSVGFKAVQSSGTVEVREQTTGSTMKIVPAKAEGPEHNFFVGTGDGGNGFFGR